MKKLTKLASVFTFLFAIVMVWNVSISNAEIWNSNSEGTQGTVATELTTKYATTGGEAFLKEGDLFQGKVFKIDIPANTSGTAIVPITIKKKGYLYFNVLTTDKFAFNVYTDAAATKKVSGSSTTYADTAGTSAYYNNYVGKVYFSKAAKYYLKITPTYTSSFDDTQGDIVYFASGFVTNENRTLKNNTYTVASQKDSTYTYYKVVVTKTGTLKAYVDDKYLSTSSTGRLYVTLTDSKKKAISEQEYTGTNVMFGVKKGTYYLKVRSVQQLYKVKYKFTAVSDKSGSTKAKAKEVKISGSKLSGVVNAGGAVTDWYKIKVTKPRKLSLKLTATIDSGRSFNVDLYNAKGKKEFSTTISNGGSLNVIYKNVYGQEVNWPKGTYYVKITRGTKKTSGTYKIWATK